MTGLSRDPDGARRDGEPRQHVSPFAGAKLPAIDAAARFAADPNPSKLDLRAGLYHDELGRVAKMACMIEAERRLAERDPRSAAYLAPEGLAEMREQASTLVFGTPDSDRLVTFQTLGGSNALRTGADLLRRTGAAETILVSDPTWADHQRIFEAAGLRVVKYPYARPGGSVDIDAMLSAIENAPGPAAVLIQASCHNPTGMDPDAASRARLLDILAARRDLIPFVDLAYQGLGSGVDEDAALPREIRARGIPALVASSFSKNFSLYNRRTGALSVIMESESERAALEGVLRAIVRSSHSSPPLDGAEIVAEVLGAADLKESWSLELERMRTRLSETRKAFVSALSASGTGERFDHISRQTGMFAYTGLTKEEVSRLRETSSIYLLGNGRLCLASLTPSSIPHVAAAIAGATRAEDLPSS